MTVRGASFEYVSAVNESLPPHPPLESYQGFVVTIARQYRTPGVSLEDLVHEGMLGLVEAARRYDPARRTKFITYAMWWVRKFVLRGLERHSQIVRIPDYQRRKRSGTPPVRARIVSLDSVPPGSTREPIRERLVDGRSLDPEAALLSRESVQRMRMALRRLTLQELRVLQHRFGLSGGPSLTLDQTGLELTMSGERVRQIESGALRRMRFDLAHSGGVRGALPGLVPKKKR